jgi:YfiH family protein
VGTVGTRDARLSRLRAPLGVTRLIVEIQNMQGRVITVPAFAGEGGIHHFFGTRLHAVGLDGKPGVSGSIRARQSHDPKVVVSVKQVHGTEALILDRPPKAGSFFPGGWDALITNQPGVLLTVRTADCVPILLYDPRRQVVAAIHAGWRGTVAGIIPKTLTLMRQHFRSKAEHVGMVIGPSAGACCYEVDEPVLRPLRSGYPYWRLVVRETGQGRALLDLPQLIERQAQSVGLDGDRIRKVRVCTICHPELFFSYRREGVVKEAMVSGVMLTHQGRGSPHVTPRPSRAKFDRTF